MKSNLLFAFLSIILVVTILLGAVDPGLAGNLIQSHPGSQLLQENGNDLFLPLVTANNEKSWSMAGANPERTSWVPEQVDGRLTPLWYTKFEPYIAPYIQIITAYNTLYISTSAGLYALDAESGAEKWVYPTAMPLGNSPTIDQGVAYVGGFDRRLHAVNAFTGEGLWTFEAGSGFHANPLIVNGVAYIGNRDGNFYAIHTRGANTGELAWMYQTAGPIDYSAAYKDGVVYFASNDSHAYALNAQTGALLWKSSKLPGLGFQTWWPVVYRDWVVFSGSSGYRAAMKPGIVLLHETMELRDVNPNYQLDPRGTPFGPVERQDGDWASKTCTIDTSRPNVTENGATVSVTEYLETKPWRRTYLVLDRSTGVEYTTDFDQDGKPEYAPILWQGTHSGNRFPPVVGGDGVIYQASDYMSDPYIAGGQVVGWKIGTPHISIISAGWIAVDEPLAYSAGGNRIYWNHCCDRSAGSIDISSPTPNFPPNWLFPGITPCSDATERPGRNITYFSYNLASLIPDYYSQYYPDQEGWSTFGGPNGIYGSHGNQNPPIPYHGKLYIHRSNALIAFAPDVGDPVELPSARIPSSPTQEVPTLTLEDIQAKLASEIEKMINAGHLLPAYHNGGHVGNVASYHCGYNNGYALGDYYHNPAETIYTLMRALPYLDGNLRAQTETYIQTEFNTFPLYNVSHIGWQAGTDRVIFDIPPEVIADRPNYPPLAQYVNFPGWAYNPFGFYAMWQYAEVFGGGRAIFDLSSNRLNRIPPANDYMTVHVEVLNAYIAGYDGFLKLEALAGYPPSTDIQAQLTRLLNLRATTFTKNTPDTLPSEYKNYCRGLNISRNFFYLTPELGAYLRDHALTRVQAAVDEYNLVAPYWFVSAFGAPYGEGATSLLYNYHSLFQVKALILNEPWHDLTRYIDEPGVPVGDLYYIDNLTSILQAASQY